MPHSHVPEFPAGSLWGPGSPESPGSNLGGQNHVYRGPEGATPGRRGEERKPDSCRSDSAKPARSAIHSLSHPPVRSTNPCRGPVGAGVGRGVEEGRRAGGSGRERCPRPAGDLSRRDPGGRRALGCGRGGEACALPPGCRPRGRGRLCSRPATGRPEQARVFCPRLWRRLTHAAPEKGVVEGGRVLCVEPEATSRRRRSRESGVAEAAARVRGLAPGCGREKRGVGCRGGGLHARRRPSTSP